MKSSALAQVSELHRRADQAAESITDALMGTHGGQLQCRRGCSGCCRDDITVFEVEAERIREELPSVLSEQPGPEGGCAFLDADGACRVYAARPYVCRTQGLPLRWFEAGPDEVVELRDICELNEPSVALMELDAEQCWLLGPLEGELAALQVRAFGSLNRVSLRSLFGASGDG